MTLFSATFLEFLIVGSLVLTGISTLTLLFLVIADYIGERIW